MFKTNKLTDKKKRLFFSQLQVLLKAGLSFTSSFSLIIEGATGYDAEVYRRMFDRVIAGASLWTALEEESDFSRLDYGVIRIGEESGQTDRRPRFSDGLL
jgi:Type II secretory pathway, component PulF